MAELRLALLGTPQLIHGGMGIDGRLPLKSRALFCYLACNGRSHTRSELAGLLWGEMTEEFARRNLRVALPKLRRSLDGHLLIEHQTLAFDRDSDYWLDVETFEYTLKRAETVEGAARRAILRDAVALYRGEFLEGVVIDGESIYNDWILPERERLRQLVLSALDRLVGICMEQGDYAAGIQFAQRLLQLDAWREDAHRQLMRMYARNGQRTLALRQFEICRDVLDAEFGVPPTEATLALHRQIMAMTEGEAPQPLPPMSAESDAAPFLAPRLIPHFTGRAAELAQLRTSLLQSGTRRVLTLVGMGGIGKSALAIETAHALRDAFPDGVLWANAATDDPKAVAERWANAYGYDFSRIPELEERAAVLRDLLQDKQVLIIFDDVTGTGWVRSFIPDSEWCVTLLTTRDAKLALALRAQVVEVDVLSPEDGRSLLADILTEERVAAEEETAVQIYQLLQGLPLALSLAAQRLAALPRRKLSWLFERLQVGLAEHGQAVKASFAISWEGLDEGCQQVFAYLAVFAGRDFHVNALAAAAELERFPAYDRLDMLATLSLLTEEEDGRFRQHTLLALFAKEKLGDDDAPFRRMIAYYGAYARENQENYAALGPEWENLSASIAQAHEMALWPVVLQLTETLQPAWFRRGRYHEARQAFQQAIEAAKALGDKRALAQCLLDWGYICFEQNDWDEAQELLLQSLGLFESLGDLAGMAAAQAKLAWVLNTKADFDEAERLLASSRSMREQLGDEVGVAATTYDEAHLRYARGDYEGAKQKYEQALKLQESLGDKLGLLRTLRSLAISRLNQDSALKKKYLQQAGELADELQDQVEMAVILRQMFTVFWQEGKYQKSEDYAFKSLELHRNLGDRRGQAMVYYLLSEFNQQQKAYDDALKNGKKSLEICRALQDIPGTAFSLHRLGDVYKCLSQFQQACQSWREALEIAKQLGHSKLSQDLTERLRGCLETARTK
ncbi:MAG: tetratricopeptide repeat protein [Chloroflexi bacterium]|nr:tetratricopeptide repeat protein [Chloroflexota bacterium]